MKLRIGFTDTFFGLADKFFEHHLSQRYDIIRDDQNPQVLIFGDEDFGVNNMNYDETKVFKLFYTGENRRFWNYRCHAGVTFDHIDHHQHFRLPLYVLEIWGMQTDHGYKSILDRESLVENTGFCSFVNSNSQCQERNNMFHALNKYKKVDSGGPLFNNIGHIIPRGTRLKTDFLKSRKFNLCYENSSYAGYATEKLVHAFYARTVPIYWGSPTVEIDFNPDAILNWHDYQDDQAFYNRIIEVDNNDELYYDMINAPPFRGNVENKFMNVDRFLDWFHVNVFRKIT